MEPDTESQSAVARTRRALESLERLEQARSQRSASDDQFQQARTVARSDLEKAGYTPAAVAQATKDGPNGSTDPPRQVTVDSLADRYLRHIAHADLRDAERAEIALDAVETMSEVAALVAESAGDNLRFRLKLSTDVIAALDALKDRLEQMRLQTAGELHFAFGAGKAEIGSLMGLTGTRVAQLLDDFYEEEFHADDRTGSACDEDERASDVPNLAKREQAILAGCVLHLMNRDLATRGDRHRVGLQRVRDDYEALVLAMGHAADVSVSDELELESSLRSVTDTAHALAMLVELCASQPWASVKRPLDPSVRKQTLGWIAETFGARVSDSDIREIDKDLEWRRRTSSSGITRWAVPLALAAVGAAVTGGAALVAAPAIGAAIGSMLGLSGAAATSAGLAALGGGSLAAGGLGMAGGTAVLVGTGSLAGTLGFMGVVPRERVTQELDKLYALVRRLHSADGSGPCEAAAAACVTSVEAQVKALKSKMLQRPGRSVKPREVQLHERRIKQLGERSKELERWLELVDPDRSIRDRDNRRLAR